MRWRMTWDWTLIDLRQKGQISSPYLTLFRDRLLILRCIPIQWGAEHRDRKKLVPMNRCPNVLRNVFPKIASGEANNIDRLSSFQIHCNRNGISHQTLEQLFVCIPNDTGSRSITCTMLWSAMTTASSAVLF
ncbi:hypothetical protein SIAM614_21552 [Stappia aggregata IAM 12614]|uniref:Uncharacterized protein n=1 Tax=Roseibium aggregatum (strain ATCC 25650 / DSM 13394 / JCM 20685 / NBRC 16684 / NCIMB 2208 / IAM 12614 / B1) TaxID=384765 RepID=A0P345_ROSAI|nr:hypothetical protein SIAM614_21552 [Stappia aggregata IAM 12614] [Roseibium aggregatum IAM 12614]